jgi:hypothetical protein
LVVVQRAVHAGEDGVSEAENGIHRSPQLMADAGEEARLRLAGASEGGVRVAQPACQRPFVVEQLGQPRTRCVQILGKHAELIAVRHLDLMREVAGNDLAERSLHLANGQHQRPRERKSQEERHQNTEPADRDDDRRQEAPVGLECLPDIDHVLVRLRDEGAEQVVLENMRSGVLPRQVQRQRLGRVTTFERISDLGARIGILGIRLACLSVEIGVVAVIGVHGIEKGGEVRLGDVNLGGPLGRHLGVLVLEERHGAVVTLGGDGVKHLLGAAYPELMGVQVIHSLVHAADHDQAEDPHAHQKQRTGQEAEQQLSVNARRDASRSVDGWFQPAQSAWELSVFRTLRTRGLAPRPLYVRLLHGQPPPNLG